MSDQKPITPPEEPEFSSRNVRSNVAPIFQILQSEQLILQRTDQKAFTLMSLLAAFMVFFIVHFPKVMDGQQINMIGAVMILIYFLNATFGLINLMLVIVPRIRNDMNHEDLPDINATFFGGIVQFKNPVSSKQGFNPSCPSLGDARNMLPGQTCITYESLGSRAVSGNACSNKGFNTWLLIVSKLPNDEFYFNCAGKTW